MRYRVRIGAKVYIRIHNQVAAVTEAKRLHQAGKGKRSPIIIEVEKGGTWEQVSSFHPEEQCKGYNGSPKEPCQNAAIVKVVHLSAGDFNEPVCMVHALVGLLARCSIDDYRAAHRIEGLHLELLAEELNSDRDE